MAFDNEIWFGRKKEENENSVLRMTIQKKRTSNSTSGVKYYFDSEALFKDISRVDATRVFKEKIPGLYTSKDGWTITEIKQPSASHAFVVSDFLMKDHEGRVAAKMPSIQAFQEKIGGEYYSYQEYKGRPYNKNGIRYCADHFPEGTVFRVNKLAAVVNFGTSDPKKDTFTVDHVLQSGPRTWLLVCKETAMHYFPEGEKETPWCFVFDHVEKIVRAGKGPVKIVYAFDEPEEALEPFLRKNKVDNQQYYSSKGVEAPKLKRGEHVFIYHDRILNVVLKHIGLDPQNQGKFVDDYEFFRFMTSQNWGRHYHFRTDDGFEMNIVLNVRKMKNWLKKNQHRVFFNLDQSAKQERVMIDSAMNALDDDD